MRARLGYLLFTNDGRIGRRTFWWAYLFALVPSGILTAVGFGFDRLLVAGLSQMPDLAPYYPKVGAITPLTFLFTGAGWYLQYAVIVKRLHDRNKRALWVWLAQVPAIGTSWLWGELGFLRGTRRPNDWGDDPRASRNIAPAAA